MVGLFSECFGMRRVMGTPLGKSDGGILGLERDVVGATDFLYDFRGPRVSPAIEVQRWVDPPLVGRPPDDPTQVGIQALGFAVPDVATTVTRLKGMGCTVVGVNSDGSWATVRDPRGVTLDLVADDRVTDAAKARMRHLRVTCRDLEASVDWYEGLGFTVIGEETWSSGEPFGIGSGVAARAVALRLPDESFRALLVQWHTPPSHGRHPPEPNHAGLWRTALGVDDTRAAYERMVAAGWRFDRAPTLVRLEGTPVPDMWIAFLSDPDGVPIELVQRPRSVFLADEEG